MGRLVLTHLQPWNDPDAAREEAAASFDGRIDLAVAGQVIDLAEASAHTVTGGSVAGCHGTRRAPVG